MNLTTGSFYKLVARTGEKGRKRTFICTFKSEKNNTFIFTNYLSDDTLQIIIANKQDIISVKQVRQNKYEEWVEMV